MLVRLGVVVVASVTALTLKRANSGSKDGQSRKRKDETRYPEHGEKEEENEEVKAISGIINSAHSDDDDMLSEIESLLSREIDIPQPSDRFDVKERSRYNNGNSELERLHGHVRDLEEREVKPEGELLEYYGLKEQETDVVELHKQLKMKTVEIDMLSVTIKLLQEDRKKLTHANEDLTKQVEGLQTNRFSEVEELVYLRWVNACVRYELRNYQTPSDKISARDLNKTLSPKSRERAKLLMLEYAGSERGQGDTDLEKASSAPSSPRREDLDNVSLDSSSSGYSFFGKRPNLMQKLKKWGRGKDDRSSLASSTQSLTSESPKSNSQKPKEALMLINAGDDMGITTLGKREQDPSDIMGEANVASSFQLMSKTVAGFADEKYPAYKDRHKLATEREKAIKEKAEKARVQRYGGVSTSGPKAALPPKLAQIKEKAPTANAESSGQSSDNQNNPLVVTQPKLANIEKRAPRVPRPPPAPSATASGAVNTTSGVPPPPGVPPGKLGGPPPPPGSLPRNLAGGDKVHHAPEVVEFYQSLMKREAMKDTTSLGSTTSSVSDVRSNMVGEIENRSAFLLAVKADVETQGEFVESLANEVREAKFVNIDDVVAFVNWLDEELSFLVDERAVLKHFDWPENKADALREAAFEYQDLLKLEHKVSSFTDDPKLPCEDALKKMYSLLEKVEQSVYALLRTRDMATSRYREYGIPVDWLSDSGVVGKIKLESVQLAKKYMKRVATELDALLGTEKEPNREFLLLQGIRFAFRVHQFAGGFDEESMKAFEELRSKMSTQTSAPQISNA
ncbi:protein CHUP1, chloroplastic-like [Oryza brachyantha]|uniref:protein CHUP1, chloroplastic-like n=1 Tax=Oryza brachyantha TaxID=4533 RepID=UPI001ADB37F1|nr:protein CHUP1, chloroplastic-like [Oryza brachyantha]